MTPEELKKESKAFQLGYKTGLAGKDQKSNMLDTDSVNAVKEYIKGYDKGSEVRKALAEMNKISERYASKFTGE